jgi:hypothetical protein
VRRLHPGQRALCASRQRVHLSGRGRGFQRSNVDRYDAEGTDVGVGYNVNQPGRQIVVTVFVYPAPPVRADPPSRARACADQFADIKRQIVTRHAGASLVEEARRPSPSPGFRDSGWRATYRFDEVFAGREQPVQSEADLYCYVHGNWFVSYRVSAPVAVDYRGPLDAFMRALAWPYG